MFCYQPLFLTPAMGKWPPVEYIPPATDVGPSRHGSRPCLLDSADISHDSGLGPTQTQPFFTIAFSCTSFAMLPPGGVPKSPAVVGLQAMETGSEWN